jgi:multidrug efflux pump subunit AcrB
MCSPGTNARVVVDTIAAPIEQQVNGVEKMLYMSSRSTSDGTYTLTVTFQDKVDLNMAHVLVQNRVALALPDLVKRRGVAVRKGSAGVGLILFLSSPNGKFDQLFLSNYANIQLRDELARTVGVAEVALAGSLDTRLKIWLDPDRLAALELATTDVAKALEHQNLMPTAAPTEPLSGRSPVLQIADGGLGRLATVEELNDLVVQADAGREVRLRDVARIQLGAARADSQARLDGKPGVAMAIHLLPLARPRDVSAALQQQMTRLATFFPEGLTLDIAFDFTANLEDAEHATSPQYILLDIDMPDEASAQRKRDIIDRADQVLRLGKEIQRVMSLTDNVFDRLPDRHCVLVRVAPAGQGQADRDPMNDAVRSQLGKQVADATFRVRDLSRPKAFPRCGYAIDFAVHGPEGNLVRSFARKLAERLRASRQLTDVWTCAETADRRRVQFDVDASAAKALGVAVTDVTDTLQVFFGSLELKGSGQFIPMELRTGREFRGHTDDIKQLKVRNSSGEPVPLLALVTLRETTGPDIEERLNGQPMVEITANPAAGRSLAETRTCCQKLAGDVCTELRLTADYRLTWLDER